MRWAMRMVAVSGFVFVVAAVAVRAGDDEDHPLVSRYPGSTLTYSHASEYDEYVLPLAPLERGAPAEVLNLEGKVTYLQYKVPGRSTLEVYRNYESALTQAGFEMLFEHEGSAYTQTHRWVAAVFEPHGIAWKSTSGAFSFAGNTFRYLAARRSDGAGEAYVVVYTTPRRGTDDALLQLDIIEMTPMDADMITVTAERIAGEIARLGFVSIYDVYFAPDSDEILGESAAALGEIAAFLNDNPGMRFYAVGHTTNIGDHDYLMDLSARRAEAMVRILVDEYGVAEGSLTAAGVGPLSPVATNETPVGQGLNRRVELVLR